MQISEASSALGSDQPLFVVEPHGMGNEQSPYSIEAMAADRLPLIMDAYPEGHYRLFGNCGAGLIAFEVARMLVAAWKSIELVAMLDPPTISALRFVQFLFWTIRRAWPVRGPRLEFAMALTWSWCENLQKFWIKLQKFCNKSWTRRWKAISTRVRKFAADAPECVEPFQYSLAEHAGGPSRR